MVKQNGKQSNSAFRQKIYTLTRQIPPGKVATYGQLAALVGSPGSARAVGMCMKGNSDPENIPCHRVVAVNGKLTGYAFGGVSTKKDRLQREGVTFINDRVDLSISLWKP